jgi:hypothetical protein
MRSDSSACYSIKRLWDKHDTDSCTDYYPIELGYHFVSAPIVSHSQGTHYLVPAALLSSFVASPFAVSLDTEMDERTRLCVSKRCCVCKAGAFFLMATET